MSNVERNMTCAKSLLVSYLFVWNIHKYVELPVLEGRNISLLFARGFRRRYSQNILKSKKYGSRII